MLKRKYNEIDCEEEENFNINSISDVKTKLDKKKKRLIEIAHEMKGLNMQIKCLESQLNQLCKHNWCKMIEDVGLYDRAPLKCMICGKIKVRPGK